MNRSWGGSHRPAIVEQGPVLGGIYLITGGETRRALAAGSAAPTGGMFAKFSEQIAIDDGGAVAFSAVLRRGGPSGAIFRLDGDTVTPLAALGEPAPGGGRFSAFAAGPALSESLKNPGTKR